MDRHETLRTTFIDVQGEPRQVIAPHLSLPLKQIDLSSMAEGQEREASLRWTMQQEAQLPFDLQQGPLFRATLVRVGQQEHVLVLAMHHIISDGWSMGVLSQELTTLYEAFCEGKPSPLAPLLVQYADFALWQQEWLQGEVLTEQLAYWKHQLAGVPAVLPLPTDHPRPALQTVDGATQAWALSAELTAALRDISKQEGVTLFMTMLAAFQTLLYRYTGQEDVVVGTPIANRSRTELEGLVGFFVNTLVLRTNLGGHPSFRMLLGRVREMALGAYVHQDVPFEKLVEELHPTRDFSRNPLFQVMLTMQNTPIRPISLPHLTMQPLEVESQTAKFDVGLFVQEEPEGLRGNIRYNTALFDPATIERMVGHLQTLLEAIVAHPEQPITTLPLLTEREYRQIVLEWNATQQEDPATRCIHQLFQDQVRRTPQAPAVVCGSERLSYQQLNSRANQLAHYLRQEGVNTADFVGLCMPRSIDMLVGLLGILKAGAGYVPVDAEHPPTRLAMQLQQVQTTLVLTHSQVKDRLAQWTGRCICLDRLGSVLNDQPTMDLHVPSAMKDGAYVIFTSGSTGVPKGVMISHGNVSNYVQGLQQLLRPEAGWHYATASTIAADLGNTMIFGSLAWRGCLHILEYETVTSAQNFAQYVQNQPLDVLKLVPSHLSALLAGTQRPILPQRWLILGGEALTSTLLERLSDHGAKCQIVNHYGPTEATIGAVVHIVGDRRSIRLRGERQATNVAIGRPIRNMQAYILDAYQQLVPIGVVGELGLGGIGLAHGYVGEPIQTAQRFVPHSWSRQGGERLYRTGDLARYLPDGTIEYLGRVDHQVKLRGYRIELGEIEVVLGQHPAVRDNTVLVQDTETGDQRLVAYVVLAQEATEKQLRSYLREHLPEYMVPSVFVLLEEMPLTPNGKMDRRALALLDWKKTELQEVVTAHTPIEQMLVQMWEQVLGVSPIGVHENFFELGGHSLNATQVVARVRDAFSLEIALRTLFQKPTIAELASFIERSLRAKHLIIEEPPHLVVPRGNTLALSFAQQRLWFLDQWEPNSSFYTISDIMRLTGKLDVATLEKSLQEIVNRHEILRTTFSSGDSEGRPFQHIAPYQPISLNITSVTTVADAKEREEALQRVLQQEASRPFDLQQGPLLRSLLVMVGEQEHVLLLTMHHIVSDGWSKSIFLQELTQLYTAFHEGFSSPLAPLPIQYADVALWQRQWLQGATLERQLAYWRQQLADAPTQLNLPTDFPRPPHQSYQGAEIDFALAPSLSRALVELGQRENATLFMVLLAAFQVLLWRSSGQEDLLIGTPIANRSRTELESLIGFFVNTLVIRADLSGHTHFRTLLRQVRETCLDAYTHQDVPFEKLVEVLQPERDLSRNPLFQVMFALQNAPSTTLHFSGLHMESLRLAQVTSKFDVSLFVWKDEETLRGLVEYRTDLFERATIERLLGHWQILLESIVADAERRLVDLPWISEAERHQLVVEWNATQVMPQQAMCFHQLFEEQARCTPDHTAVIDENQQLTYTELNSRANQLARYLRMLGVGPEMLVSLFMERGSALLVAILAIFKAGGAYLPLDPFHPIARLRQTLARSGSRLVLASHTCAPTLSAVMADVAPSARSQIVYLEHVSLDEQSQENVPTCTAASHLAYVMYTSGSTGEPKGAMIEQKGMLNHLHAKINALKLTASDGVAQTASQCFDISVWQLLAALLVGGRVHIYKDEVAHDPFHLLQRLEMDGISILEVVPSLLQAMLGEKGSDDLARPALQKLRWIVPTGEALPPEVGRQWFQRYPRIPLLNAYGPTECSDDVTHHSLFSSLAFKNAYTPIGRPIENTQIYVLDHQLGLVPVGWVGELYVGGVGVGRGYLHAAEQTAVSFIPDPFRQEPGERLYRTGDLARHLPDGTIEYLGRVDHQVKVRGYRIELGEIEAVLGQHPAVRGNTVLVQETETGDQRLVAYVVLPPEAAEQELRSYLREHLPEYMVPSAFVLLEEMPLTPNGKIDRRGLALLDWKKTEPQEEVIAHTLIEQMLVQMWEQLLGVSPIGVHENLFELGGHSLLITQMRSRVRDSLQVEIPLRAFFEKPTIADVALLIEQTQREMGNGALIKEFDGFNQDDIEQILGDLETLADHEILQILDSMQI